MTAVARGLQVGAAVLAVAASLACHPKPRPATGSAPPALTRLQHDIDSILTAPVLSHGFWGVLIKSLETDETLFSLNADRLLMPASNLKIVTLAAAAARLGWNYRYETRVYASGPFEAGTLRGDLIVVGSGDPSIGGRDEPVASVFDTWAEELKALGVRRIEGGVVGDDRAFDEERLGPGWTWDDLGEGYSAGISALQFNENSVRATILPGAVPGDRAIVTLEPEGSGLVVESDVRTGESDAPSITARRLPGSDRLELHGVVPAGHQPLGRTVSVDNPTRFFVTALRGVLTAHGIVVEGTAEDIHGLPAGPGPPDDLTLLLVHSSPPLSSLAPTLMKISQNLYGETMLKTLGAAVATPTTDGGRNAALAVVQAWGVAPEGLIMRDGSGLSRYNYVTARTLVTILTHIDRDNALQGPFETALPIAGRDGTLAHRMAGTRAAGNARAKTGSLSNARALSGYVRTAGNEPLVFSIMANNFESSGSVVEQAIDAIIVRLAEFSR